MTDPNESNEQAMREAFEVKFSGFALYRQRLTPTELDTAYDNPMTQAAWMGYQAGVAQASLATPQPQTVHDSLVVIICDLVIAFDPAYKSTDAMKVNAINSARKVLIEPLSVTDNEKDCKHESWEDKGGWSVCVDCGHGWDSVAVQEPVEGWKLVPIEPTKMMIEAARSHYESQAYTGAVSTYKAMLAASPTLDKE